MADVYGLLQSSVSCCITCFLGTMLLHLNHYILFHFAKVDLHRVCEFYVVVGLMG